MEESIKSNLSPGEQKILDFSNRELTAIPTEVFRNTKLEELDLSNNRLVGLHSELLKLKNLRVLNLSHNLLEELPDFLPQLKDLKELHLMGNEFSVFPEILLQMKHLDTIDLRKNYIKSFPADLEDLKITTKVLLDKDPMPTSEMLYIEKILHNDQWAAKDLLGYELYATAIKELITYKHLGEKERDSIRKTKPPLTIAILAPWGQGKTTLMRYIERDCEKLREIIKRNKNIPVKRQNSIRNQSEIPVKFRELKSWIKSIQREPGSEGGKNKRTRYHFY